MNYVLLVTHYVLSGKYGQHQNDHTKHDKPNRYQLHLRSAMDLLAVLFVCSRACLQLADVGRLHAINAAQPPGFGAEVVLTYFTGANDAIGHSSPHNTTLTLILALFPALGRMARLAGRRLG